MPLIFIAVFIAAFLSGSGVGYLAQSGQGGTGSPSGASITPTPSSDYNPLACIPERETISKKWQIAPSDNLIESLIKIEATKDLPVPPDNNQDFAPCPGDCLTNDMVKKENWTKILLYLFGGEKNPYGTDIDLNLDRRQNTWTLIKKDVPIPSWKVAFQSGTMQWTIDSSNVVFHEMTRIGRLDYNNIINQELKTRYINKKNQAPPSEAPDYEDMAEAVGDVWIATGWCGKSWVKDENKVNIGDVGLNPIDSQIGCADPILRNLLFVVTKKGRGNRLGRTAGNPVNDNTNPDNSSDPKIRDKSWWRFDVYYDFKSRDITYNNVPCWMRKYCIEPSKAPGDQFNPQDRINPFNLQNLPCSEITPKTTPPPGAYNRLENQIKKLVLLKDKIENRLSNFFSVQKAVAQKNVNFPQFVSGKAISYEAGLNESLKINLSLNTYIINTSTTLPSDNQKVGLLNGVDGDLFEVYVSKAGIINTPPPTPTPFYANGISQIFLQLGSQVYSYNFVHGQNQQGSNLKLDTFLPPVQESSSIPTSFTYEWYTPACKPAIYLYPTKETRLSVFVKPQGIITESIPSYNLGWQNVLAKPDGELVYNNSSFPYLYYEAEVKNVTAPKNGWVVKKEDLEVFFNTLLPYLGLNEQEKTDFKDYWLKKLNNAPYYFLGLLSRETLDNLETIEFSKKPDTFIRVRFYFEGLEKGAIVASPLLPKTPQRVGFTAVDWGGIIVNDFCSLEGLQVIQ